MDGKQLKNSILQWAIQGKLVPQNPKDEPASKLLERIRDERRETKDERTVKKNASSTSLRGAKATKQSKKAAPTSRIYRENGVWYEQVGNAEPKDISDDIPFEIPENWAWCRLNHLTELIEDCPHSTASNEGSGYPLIRTPNIGFGRLDLRGVHRVSEDVYNKRNARAIPQSGDLIFAREAPAGNIAVIQEGEIVCLGQRTVLIRPKKDVLNADYLAFYILSPISQQMLVGKSTGTTVAHVNLADLRPYFIALPPLAEQKRIVAKLEQVLPLADEYGAAQEELDKLNKELPEALKKSILQQAIQGKLVPQNPKDEPAQKLLERITVARGEGSLPKSAKSKKSTPTSRIYCENGTWYEQIGNAEPKDISEDIPFDIPTSWVWCRFNSICDIARGGSPRPIQDYLTDSPEGYNWIKIGDTEKGGKYINSTKERIKPEGLTKTRLIHKGDFLLTNSMSFGRPYISNIDGCIHDGWLVISILGNAFVPDYLYYLLSSQYAYRQFCGRVAGAVVKNLNIDKVAESLIPLPPLAEQKRIVTKLEQLFKVL